MNAKNKKPINKADRTTLQQESKNSRIRFSQIDKFLKKNANAIQKLATEHHKKFIGGEKFRSEIIDKYQKNHIKIVESFAKNLKQPSIKEGVNIFKKLGETLANDSVKDKLHIEEAVDGIIFLKQATWQMMYEEGLLKNLTPEEFYEISQSIGTYCDVTASKIAFTYHNRAIENQKETQASLQLQITQLEAVSMLGQKALSGISIQQLMDEATLLVINTLKIDFCKILEYIPEDNKLLFREGKGWKKGIVGRVTISSEKKSLGGYALHHRKPVVFEDIDLEDRFIIPSVFTEHKIRSGIHVIIHGEKKPFGLLGACSKKTHQFSKDDISFLQAIANILGQAIQRDKSQRVLQESEERYRLIIEGVKDYAIFNMDTNGVILSWNNGAERILGYREDEVIGKNFSMFFTKEDINRNKPKRELNAALNKQSVLNENWSVAKGNRLFWSSGVSTAIRDKNGNILGLVKIFRDRTEIKDIEQKKDQFVSLISHELKTPITSIKMYTQILQKKLEKNAEESILRALAHIKNQTDRLTELISNLLEKSKIRARGFTYTDEDFDLEDAVKESVENIKHSKASHEIIVKGKITKKINADRERIQQVFENLLSNAIKYSPHSQKVIVYLKSDNKTATVCVEDFGFGISKENIENIFLPFFRAEDTQREAFPSIGLGLYISSEIIKNYNGKISVKSEKGKGSTFCFTIPNSLK